MPSPQLRRVFVGAVLALAGCGDSIKWTEDVLLPDGRVLALSRYQEFRGPYEIGDTPTESFYWFEFTHPDTGVRVRWEAKREPAPVALFIHQRVPFLVTKPRFISGFEDLGCPDPMYLLFRFDDGAWTRVDLKAIPVRALRSNMTHGVKSRRGEIERSQHHLSVEQTSNAVYNDRYWVMDFTRFDEQTFREENCTRPVNDLIRKDNP